MAIESLITDHLDLWTAAARPKSRAGRGGNSKLELTGIKKLRELILELAVRGKLVPQDPSDEPAPVLLERITAEKAQLVKEGKIKKPKALPEISEEDKPFALPEGWAWAVMPQVVKNDKYAIKRGPFGSSLQKSFFVRQGYKVYEQQHAINNDFYCGEYYISDNKFEELKAFEVKPFDLIISCSGTVGKVAVAPLDMEPGIINQALLKISLNTLALTNEYFKVLFPAYFMKTETLSELQGTAQKNMVSVDVLKNEPFPYPPIDEQHRIVAKVDELMALCDQLEQRSESQLAAHQALVETLLATLTDSADVDELAQNWARLSTHFDTLFTTEASIDALKQTILQLAVMGKLVPQDPTDEPASALLARIAAEKARLVKEKKIKAQKLLPPIAEDEKPFSLPQGWEWVRLQQVVTILGDGLHGTPNYDSNGEYFFVNGNNLENGRILIKPDTKRVNKSEFEKYQKPLTDRTILVSINGTLGKVGFYSDEKIVLGKSACYFNLSELLSKPYIKRVIESSYFVDYAFSKATGSTIKNLGLKAMNEFSIALPPVEEMNRIVAKIDQLMAICDQLKASLQTSQQTQLALAESLVEEALS
ncbi:restriction endonuclease subunit S [Aeromonas lusitana]|uniref:Type I restriction endonuclease subunit S n=1 Tax=Aeromonas lusitana TaxID=931529 RepID=A0A2M8H885_9GAMM|nr:restriction endonuclease subunit S [Aeromonas lusitana]PJC92787.1 type I restriction endonuclease subunit S [Aeromonas lusitana]